MARCSFHSILRMVSVWVISGSLSLGISRKQAVAPMSETASSPQESDLCLRHHPIHLSSHLWRGLSKLILSRKRLGANLSLPLYHQ